MIAVELCLGAVLHSVLEGKAEPARPPRRRSAGGAQARVRPRRGRHARHESEPRESANPYVPRTRILLPIRASTGGLLDETIRECLSHRAELTCLFVRVLAALPMSPAFEPTEAEDAEAVATLREARRKAERAGVPFRSDYVVTHRPAAAILDRALATESDYIVLAPPRRGALGLVSAWFGRDETRSILNGLPGRIGLLIHA